MKIQVVGDVNVDGTVPTEDIQMAAMVYFQMDGKIDHVVLYDEAPKSVDTLEESLTFLNNLEQFCDRLIHLGVDLKVLSKTAIDAMISRDKDVTN